MLQSSCNHTFKNGLDFIISHFVGQHIWPRRISANGVYFKDPVYSEGDALRIFAQSGLVDCRINAYAPLAERWNNYISQPPSLLFFDIDVKRYLNFVLTRIKSALGGVPSVIETSEGHYHILQPVAAPTLEDLYFEMDQPSNTFLRFVEQYLSNGYSDPNNHPNFNSCMLRLPGSIRENGYRVRVEQEWNGEKVSIFPLLEPFTIYLAESITPQICNNFKIPSGPRIYRWIERFLRIPIEDRRQLVMGIIFSPYLMNIRQLSHDHAYQLIMEWFDKCNSLRPLQGNYKNIVKYHLKYVQRRGYRPLSLYNLKRRNEHLYNLVAER
jgi:hypothetical protein